MLTIVPVKTATPPALAHDLRLAVMRLSRRLRSQRADTSMTLTHLAALSTLYAKGPLTPGELAAHEKVQPPSMTRVVCALEERGFVLRAPHPTDGRQVIVSLTPAAEDFLLEEIRMREAWLTRRLAELTDEEREILQVASEVIGRLVDS
ncbi:MAG: MarR family transcriptional regulator [Geodermatophilaceae bacterium]|nr:MarR family transcriptional regulator [Geodermatophilaceae bacterium]